jgi:hypothetical protein
MFNVVCFKDDAILLEVALQAFPTTITLFKSASDFSTKHPSFTPFHQQLSGLI